jgi:hypothetical protein
MRAAANVLLRFVVGLDQRCIDALGGCPGAGEWINNAAALAPNWY